MNKYKLDSNISLPDDFQEKVILREIRFRNGERDINLIRELVFLYMIGIEYYDSLRNEVLYRYFYDKNLEILNNEQVKIILDKNKSNILEMKNIDKFINNPYVINSSYSNSHKNFKNEINFNSNTIISVNPYKSNKNNSEEVINEEKYINLLNKNFSAIENLLIIDLNNQKLNFENNLNKIKKDKSRLNKKTIWEKIKQKKIDLINFKKQESKKILKNILELSEKKMKNHMVRMESEIDEYIEKNITDMSIALNDLKLSFEQQINSLDSNLHYDLINSLKEDMKNELENLKLQYEEQRHDEIARIKDKYKFL